jgi:hypothetical protein
VDQGIISGLSFATSSIIARATGSYGLGIAHLALTMVIFMMNAQAELTIAPFTVYRSRRQGSKLAVYSRSTWDEEWRATSDTPCPELRELLRAVSICVLWHVDCVTIGGVPANESERRDCTAQHAC